MKRVTVKISKLVILIVALLFCAIIAKLCYVVLSEKVDGINLKEKSASITTTKRTLYASRGSIYDANGDELAISVNSYTVVAYLHSNKNNVEDVEGTAEALAPILNMTKERLVSLMSKDAYQVELGPGGRDITEAVKSQIERLDLQGIGFMKTSKKRYYGKATFASYIVGYAKKNDDGSLVGELGIEGYYNDILSGTNGYTKYLKYTASNYQIPNTPSETVEAVDGANIYLTIDSNIQLIAEKTVDRLANYNIEWGIVAVMDANTGAIVASATNPTFDPNNTNTLKDAGYINPLVSYTYEPGSVMKIFSFASAIEEGKYNGEEKYKSGSIPVADVVIRDAKREGWGTINFDTGFAYSSNVAATILALRVGVNRLSHYYDELGFGKKTGIELSNESVGDADFVYQSELATASFGQGISITPVQMLSALSFLTNNGVTLKPYVVDKIVDGNGNVVYEGKRKELKQVFSEKTTKKMQELMHKMVYDGLVNYWQPDNVTLIGKTGTAQIASKKGGYISGEYQYVKSFAGVFPEENPKYIIYIAARHIEGTSRNFANVVTTAVEEIASYAKLTQATSDVDTTKIVKIGNYNSKKIEDIKSDLEKLKVDLVILGNGKYVIDQYPAKNSTMLSNGKLFILTNSNEIVMPDLNGWSLNEVKTFASMIGLSLDYTGYGYVVSQSITKNEIIDSNTLKIELKE